MLGPFLVPCGALFSFGSYLDAFELRWELKRLAKEAAEGEDPIDDDADMEAARKMPCTVQSFFSKLLNKLRVVNQKHGRRRN